ncbi:hypothetical protein FACS189475_07940 [Betaproteobacteria bacterium]|nr:hypothetical protein FACS189475_07940 [Betaproteobacteria bacterium]
MSTASSFEAATNIVHFAVGNVGKYFGGTFGQAYGMFMSSQGGVLGSFADAIDKYSTWRLVA